VILLDANILLYAHHPEMPEHARAREWLELQFAKPETIGLCWLSIWAFLRVSSNTQIWLRSKPIHEQFDRIDEWLEHPRVVVLHPGPRYRHILREITVSANAVGRLASDAAIAALAIEHAATLASTDRDFRRFSGLRWINPLD